MTYDLRDIKSVPIIGVAKKLGIKLELRGEQVHAECPFRFPNDAVHDASPSLVFNKPSNAFRCLFCGNSGGVLDLVCQVAHVGPSQAIEWIGQNFCLPGVASHGAKNATAAGEKTTRHVGELKAGPPTLSDAYGDLLRLLGEPSPEAVAYMEHRGISRETLNRHGITDIKGYHATADFLKNKYQSDLLRQAGIFDATGRLWFDEYPLIFPYFRDGEVAFIQAHCMDSDKKPRYLRPREAVPFLYNVDVLRTLADGDQVFLVEGCIDCLTLTELGYSAVAVPSMTHFRAEWVSDFRGPEAFLVHSGGDAAERAAHAIAVVFAKADLPLRSLTLPRGHDLNSFFAKGGTQAEFEHLVQTAPKIKTSRPILEPESRSAMAEFLDQLQQCQKERKAAGHPFLGLDTGFPVLTQLSGGFDPTGSGQMCVLTGPPGIGKTTFSLQLAWQALQNNEVAVLYVSYNERKFVLRVRSLCQFGKMAASSVLRGEVSPDRFASAVDEMSKWGKGFLFVEGDKTTSVDILRGYCQRVESITGESRVFLIVDHLEAMPCPEQALDGNAKIEACVSQLHLLSRQLAIPVLVVSSTAVRCAQSAAQSGSPAGTIEYSEDLMMVLERDREASKGRFLEGEGFTVKLHVAKNRYGETGAVLFDFLADCSYFKETGRGHSGVPKSSQAQPDRGQKDRDVQSDGTLSARKPAPA